MPWARLQGLCLGGLRWSPQDFWQASPQDLAAALDFIAEQQSGLNSADLAALRAKLEAEHGT